MLTVIAQTPVISPTTVFYWTLLFIFLAGIITTIVTKWARDKCLKFFRGYHVTLERAGGATAWGKLKVFPTGIEIVYDHPYINSRGIQKNSFMLYQPELDTQLRTLLRYHDELTPGEQAARQRQIQRSFRPRPLRRLWRTMRNFINTLRDAFNAAIGALVGQYQRMNPTSAVATSQTGQMTQIGQTLLGKLANAYEPLLEQYIGQAIILDVLDPSDPTKPTLEYTGYLADYTQQFIALFNVQHTTEQTFDIALPTASQPAALTPDPAAANATPNSASAAPQKRPEDLGLSITTESNRVRVRNISPWPIVARQVERAGFEPVELGMTIPPRGYLELTLGDAAGARLSLERVRGVDVIAPRKIATVRHAGEWCEPRGLFDNFDLMQLPLVPKLLRRDNDDTDADDEPADQPSHE